MTVAGRTVRWVPSGAGIMAEPVSAFTGEAGAATPGDEIATGGVEMEQIAGPP